MNPSQALAAVARECRAVAYKKSGRTASRLSLRLFRPGAERRSIWFLRALLRSAIDEQAKTAVREAVETLGGKACGCGRVHSREQWAALPYVGPMGDDEETLECRNCACGSTLAIVVSRNSRAA